jgi:hypothetical protein
MHVMAWLCQASADSRTDLWRPSAWTPNADPRQQNAALVHGNQTDYVLLQYPKATTATMLAGKEGSSGSSDAGAAQPPAIPLDHDPAVPNHEGYEKFEALLKSSGLVAGAPPMADPQKRPMLWSCCAQFVVPGSKLRTRSREFYEQALQIVIDPRNGKDMAKAVEWTIYEIMYPQVTLRIPRAYHGRDKGTLCPFPGRASTPTGSTFSVAPC